mmetsp:Transcript_159122/g.280961  ORF Transcript_159122/g.280961 Transcript_159122/m.280961 type:complete len:148 (+) Transcript_159122:164-607(+)
MDKVVFDGEEAGVSSEAPPGKLPHWASNLEENIDKKLLVILRDGRKLFGWLRTFDQFANLLLEHTVERHILIDVERDEKKFADLYLGTMLVRGENVCLFGEVEPERENGPLQEAPLSYVLEREAELEAKEAARGVVRRSADFFFDVE